MLTVIFCIVLAIFLGWIASKLKTPKCGSVILITGGVKTGKTSLSIWLVWTKWKSKCFAVWLYNHLFRFLTKKREKKEKPQVYSNIPLKFPYIPLTEDLIYRRKRFIYGSVVYICEASLVAGSMDFKDEALNENLTLLVKLIGHELKSGDGCLIIDTQSVDDLHYGFKRNLSTYFYIHHKYLLPFFLMLKVRELIYLDGSTNTFESDVEDTMLTIFVPKWIWKQFDCYCYSALTDNLPVERSVVHTKDLKARTILTFKKCRKYFLGGQNENEKI